MRYRYYAVVQDLAGNVVSGADVSVYLAGTTTPANVYTSPTGGTGINTPPQLRTGPDGVVEFWLEHSEYSYGQLFKLVIQSGSLSKTVDNVQIINWATTPYTVDATGASDNQVVVFNVTARKLQAGAGVYVTSDGSVGIGTNAPSARLHVRVPGESIYFGSGIVSYPSTPDVGAGNLVGKGAVSDFRIAIQDGSGRVNMYWNAYYDPSAGVHRYIVSNEEANRLQMSSGNFGFYLAPKGTAGDTISWINAMYITNSGNVGIGTVAPSAKLSVMGGIDFGPVASGDGSRYIEWYTSSWGSGYGHRIYSYDPGGGTHLRIAGRNNSATWTDIVTITSGGNVGIGTVAPSAKLHVVGDAVVSGSVGVGTTSPVGKLDVYGLVVGDCLVEVNGYVDVAKGIVPTVTAGTLFGGGPTFRGQNSYWYVNSFPASLVLDLGEVVDQIRVITFGTFWRDDVRVIPRDYTIEYSNDGSTWTTAVSVSGNTSAQVRHSVSFDARYVRLNVLAPQVGYTYVIVAGLQVLANSGAALYGTNLWGVKGDNMFTAVVGNVGIGTTAPSQKLTVAGNIGIQAGANAFIGTLDSYALSLITNNINRVYIGPAGNVGIGTSTPYTKLDVRGEISWGGSAQNVLSMDQGGAIELGGRNDLANPVSGGRPYIDFHYGNGLAQDFNFRIINFADNRLDFASAGQGTFVTFNAGRVGIGTTAPGEELDVVGNVRASGQFISTVATGTAPLLVTSTTLCTNLNADMLDSLHADDFIAMSFFFGG